MFTSFRQRIQESHSPGMCAGKFVDHLLIVHWYVSVHKEQKQSNHAVLTSFFPLSVFTCQIAEWLLSTDAAATGEISNRRTSSSIVNLYTVSSDETSTVFTRLSFTHLLMSVFDIRMIFAQCAACNQHLKIADASAQWGRPLRPSLDAPSLPNAELWLKNAPTLADYNYDPVQSILIIFSKLFVNDHKSCLVVKYSTSPHVCCHYTL